MDKNNEDKCICRCGINIIEDEEVVIINEGKKDEEHLCKKCWTKDVIGESLSFAICDGQNQIYDLKAGNATGEEVNKRMQQSYDYHLNKTMEQLFNHPLKGE